MSTTISKSLSLSLALFRTQAAYFLIPFRLRLLFIFWDPPGGGGAGCLPTPGGPKMAHMPGAAGNFFDRFDTTTKEKREKCLPSAGPPGPKKSGCLGTAGTPPPRGF